MKKKLLAIAAILMMMVALIVLTGCGEESKSSSSSSVEASSPKEAVEQFLDYVEAGKFSKASKLVDWSKTYKVYDDSYYSWSSYDYSEVEEMSKKEWKEYEEDNESSIEDAQEYFEDYQDIVKKMSSIKFKADLEKAEKVDDTKNIYEVEAYIEMVWKENKKDDEESSDRTINFYVIKEDGNYYIIDGVYQLKGLLADLYW